MKQKRVSGLDFHRLRLESGEVLAKNSNRLTLILALMVAACPLMLYLSALSVFRLTVFPLFSEREFLGTLIAADIDMVVIYVVCGMGVVGCVVNYFGNKIGYKHEKEKKPLNRKRDYLNRVYHLPDYAKEIRTGSVSDLLLREADSNNEDRVKLAKKYGTDDSYSYINGVLSSYEKSL